jgi:hypothetical protein
MRRVAVLAAAVAAGAVLAGPAGSAWAEESAQDTINRLQNEGYTVTLDKLGTGPMSTCVVTSVRNPRTVTQWLPYFGPGRGGADSDSRILIPVVTSQSIAVSLDCSQR